MDFVGASLVTKRGFFDCNVTPSWYYNKQNKMFCQNVEGHANASQGGERIEKGTLYAKQLFKASYK